MLDDLVAQIATAPLLNGKAQKAWSMQPVDELSEDAPACFVFPSKESAGGDLLDNTVVQQVATEWSLMIVCEFAVLETLRGQIRDKLLGWQATPQHFPMTFVSGEAVDIKGDYLWWLDTYRSSIHIRSVL